MAPFWHPLSTILLTNPTCFATEVLLRTLLRVDRSTELLYAGDRMWPAVSHGDRFTVDAADGRAAVAGAAVVVCADGIPDLLRIASIENDRLLLRADADPGVHQSIGVDDVLGIARLASARVGVGSSRLRRLGLDVGEALSGSPDSTKDPAKTVLDKYDTQAPFYAGAETTDLDPRLGERIRRDVPSRSRVLVVGSGSGRECFALAREGYAVTGLDFAPAMIEHATLEAGRRGLEVEFLLGDARTQTLGENCLGAVLFTYDVYSFIPGRAARIEVLTRLRSLLEPSGRLFLSARRRNSAYDRAILSLQWAKTAGRGEWGDSHTRWISGDGGLRRSFVRVFTSRDLNSEIGEAGFRLESWEAGHGTLVPRLL